MDSSTSGSRKLLTRRNFLKTAGIAAIGLPLYAAEIARHEISIERRTIRLDRLPDEFRALKIVQVSDFHYAEYTEPLFLHEIVHQINRLKPDIVLFTGDFVTIGFASVQRTQDFAYRCTEILGRVECSARYAVLGNHDSTFAEPAVIDALALNKITLLNNAYIPLERGNSRLWLAGSGDASNRMMDLDKALPTHLQSDPSPVILMVHEPDVLPQVARRNVDFMLSGHTHGGQVRIPFMPLIHLPPLGKHYIQGLFRLGPTQLYVNRGIGTVGVPMRLNCPPEITVFTLE
jgi:hypothetical protein